MSRIDLTSCSSSQNEYTFKDIYAEDFDPIPAKVRLGKRPSAAIDLAYRNFNLGVPHKISVAWVASTECNNSC